MADKQHFPKGLDNRMRDKEVKFAKSEATPTSARYVKNMVMTSQRATGPTRISERYFKRRALKPSANS